MDGKLIGKVLGYFSHPDEWAGKPFVFPRIFAEIMACHMKLHGVTEEDLAAIAVQEYANANQNPYAQMQKARVRLEQVMKIEGINRYVVDGLQVKNPRLAATFNIGGPICASVCTVLRAA